MTDMQRIEKSEKINGYKTFIKNKLIYTDSSLNYDDPIYNDTYFKTTYPILIDLENYKTQVNRFGVTLLS